MSDTLFVTSAIPELTGLARQLRAETATVPECPVLAETSGAVGAGDGYAAAWDATQALQDWRSTVCAGDRHRRVVVAVWSSAHTNSPLTDMSASEFARRTEWPYAAWFAALGAAVSRCADGGAIVALVERPSPLDCAGWAPESGIADAVEALVRSLARSEGPRGIRVNGVTTPARLAPERVVAPLPPLPSYPGRVDVEVARAVEMMLGDGVCGVTGTVVHVDCGRSWR